MTPPPGDFYPSRVQVLFTQTKVLFCLLVFGVGILSYDGSASAQIPGPDGTQERAQVEGTPSSPQQAAPGTTSMASRKLSRYTILGYGTVSLVLLAFVGLRRRPWRNTPIFFGAILLFLAAFALRWTWAEHTVFHENHHGFDYIRSISSAFGQTYGFASSYVIWMHELSQLWQPVDDGIFFFNTLFSALSCPLLGILVFRLSGSMPAACIAACMWAITPHAIRLGPTAGYFNYVTCLFLGATIALSMALETSKEGEKGEAWPWILLSLCLVILEARSRVLTLVHPAAILLLALGTGGGKTNRERMMLIFGSIGILLGLLPQAIEVWNVAEHAGKGRSLVDITHTLEYAQDFVFLNPEVVSWALLPLATLGGIGLLLGVFQPGARYGLLTVLGILFVGVVAGSVHGTFPSRVRFEIPVNALLTGAAGMGAAWLLRVVETRGILVRWGLVILVSASALTSAGFVRTPMHEAVEYTFLRGQVLPELEKRGVTRLLVPDSPSPTGSIPNAWWKNHRPSLNASSTDPTAEYAYIGLECFWSAPGWDEGYPWKEPFPETKQLTNGPFSIHPACDAELKDYSWTPILLERVGRAIPNPCVDLKPGVNEVQFGLFKRDVSGD